MRANPLLKQVGVGWSLEIETFLGPVKWRRAVSRVSLGAQKRWDISAPPLLFELSVHDICVSDSEVNVWHPAHPPTGEGLVGHWVRWVEVHPTQRKTPSPTPLFLSLHPLSHGCCTRPSAGALGFVPNPTSLSKICSGEACNNYMAALCLLCAREECGFSTCHRRLPVWFYIIISVFLQAFSVSKTLLYGLWSRLLGGFSKLVSNFKGAS